MDQGTTVSPGVLNTALLYPRRVMPSLFARALAGIEFDSVYEPFAGEAKLGYHFKREGKRIVSGNRLACHHRLAQAIIENGHRRVSQAQWQTWQLIVKDATIAKRFKGWSRHGLSPEEIIWLGLWHHQLHLPEVDTYSQAIGVSAVGLVLKYWLNRGSHHREPMHHPKQLLAHYVQRLNSWVCDNGQDNLAILGDANEHAPGVSADVLLCYPPSHVECPAGSNLVWMHESWIRGDHDPIFRTTQEATDGAPALGASLSPECYERALTRFLARAVHIPVWAIGINSAEPIGEKALKALVEKFRPVRRLVSCPFQLDRKQDGIKEYVLLAH